MRFLPPSTAILAQSLAAMARRDLRAAAGEIEQRHAANIDRRPGHAAEGEHAERDQPARNMAGSAIKHQRGFVKVGDGHGGADHCARSSAGARSGLRTVAFLHRCSVDDFGAKMS
jgi:hypothetical protein